MLAMAMAAKGWAAEGNAEDGSSVHVEADNVLKAATLEQALLVVGASEVNVWERRLAAVLVFGSTLHFE